MGLWRSLEGTVRIEIVSADPAGYLTDAMSLGLDMQSVQFINALTVTAYVPRRSYHSCKRLTEKRGDKLRILSRNGIYWSLKEMAMRPVLWLGMLALLIVVFYIPAHIYFVSVEGNCRIPDQVILEQAEICGITFGAKRSLVRSEKIKNALLTQLPELQWAGINTKGCTATIHVREKAVDPPLGTTASGVYSIVAAYDGLVREATGVRGNVLVKPGQAVKEGQVLISGYTDCGLTIRATRAEGEVQAETLRTLQVITAAEVESRTDKTGNKTRYCLRIGKKLIKLYKDSGISSATCVKMYSEKQLTLPGGWELPVTLIKEELISTGFQQITLSEDQVHWLARSAGEYLKTQMVAGVVLRETVNITAESGILRLEGRYNCLEMIGKLKKEEIILPNGEND